MLSAKFSKKLYCLVKCSGTFDVGWIGTSLNSFANNFKLIEEHFRISKCMRSLSVHSDAKRVIPISEDEFKSLKRLKPTQPEQPHLLKVAILGEPNVGKSTLTNSLVKWKVCAVSRKVHTTRKKAAAVLVHENKQIIFLDTPGFVTPEKSKRHSLEPSFVMDPLSSLREADLISVVVDISNKWTNNRINEDILEVLEDFKDKKSILILNKVDAMKSKSRILSLTRILTDGKLNISVDNLDSEHTENSEVLSGQVESEKMYKDFQTEEANSLLQSHKPKRGWPLFSRVFMISALKNDGVDTLREYLLSEALPRNWMFHDSIVTDQHPHEIALLTVREKLLEYLPEEIPYTLDLKITKWEMLSTGCPKIDIKIVCSNSRHKSFVIGPNGKHITACVERSRSAMRESFRKDVVLNLAVV